MLIYYCQCSCALYNANNMTVNVLFNDNVKQCCKMYVCTHNMIKVRSLIKENVFIQCTTINPSLDTSTINIQNNCRAHFSMVTDTMVTWVVIANESTPVCWGVICFIPII